MSVYSCADLHGMYDLWEQIRDFLQPNDRLIFLGDAIDRGPDGYQIMCEMLSDPRVTYLMGNHEYMMYHALEEIENDMPSDNFHLWMYNGGEPTYNAWQAAGGHFGIISALKTLPYEIEYLNSFSEKIYLCHAGFAPQIGAEPSYPMSEDEKYDLVWDRTHITCPCSSSDYFVVHGHTPSLNLMSTLNRYSRTSILRQYRTKNGVVFYGNDHKIDIDCGSVVTGVTALLDLDSLKTSSFKGEPVYHDI